MDDRPEWGNQAQYLLTCIGFAVGLGNIWRFPYTLQSNGGGAFLIPYFIMLFLEGIPLLYVELSVGQLFRAGSIGVWNKINPLLAGIGVCSMMASFLVGVFYNTIMAWCIWYLFNSFQDPLPWEECPAAAAGQGNLTSECTTSSPSQYFWYRNTLNISPGIEEGGGTQEHILACLILAWLLVLVCLIKGIASSGKVVYFTVIFPYVVLLIFLVPGLLLEGSYVGIKYLFSADLSKLKDPSIWLAAATQIFFSLGLGFGGMIAFASYTSKSSNCARDSFFIAFVNSITSILASFVIFSILGFKATLKYKDCIDGNIAELGKEIGAESNITIDNYETFLQSHDVEDLNLTRCDVEDFLDKSASGPGLAFIVMADAIVSMPFPQFWSALFFLMLLTLGIDSMFGTLEGLTTAIHDLLAPRRVKQTHLIILLVAISFLLSIIFAQGSGSYWVDIFNEYAGGIPLMIIAFFELIAVGWFYRYSRFAGEVDEMLGNAKGCMIKGLSYYWYATVPFISPLLLLAVFLGYLYQMLTAPNSYEVWVGEVGETMYVDYPVFSVVVGAIIALSCTVWIPAVAAVRGIKSCWTRLIFARAIYDESSETDNLVVVEDNVRNETGINKGHSPTGNKSNSVFLQL